MADKPNSNAVATSKENHTSSLALRLSRLRTAKDTTATGIITPASSPPRDNSQMKHPANKSANQTLTDGRNATTRPRSARTAPRAHQTATLTLSAKPVATSPMLNAMTPPENAKNATRGQIQIALNQREPARVDAESSTTPRPSATRLQENAKNATHNTVERDASQLLLAKKDANQAPSQMTNMNASGKLIRQNVKNLMLVPTPRKNAMMHAKHQTSLNATSRTTNALDAQLARTLTACTLSTTARSCKKEENANHKLYKDSSE
jgi:hypothetical protein